MPNETFDDVGLEAFLNEIKVGSQSLEHITVVLKGLSNNGKDVDDYLFNLRGAIQQLGKVRDDCPKWRKYCYEKRSWWGLGEILSRNIQKLTEKEYDVNLILSVLEPQLPIAEKAVIKKRVARQLKTADCPCSIKTDSLSSPINGDFTNEVELPLSHEESGHERAGIIPRTHSLQLTSKDGDVAVI